MTYIISRTRALRPETSPHRPSQTIWRGSCVIWLQCLQNLCMDSRLQNRPRRKGLEVIAAAYSLEKANIELSHTNASYMAASSGNGELKTTVSTPWMVQNDRLWERVRSGGQRRCFWPTKCFKVLILRPLVVSMPALATNPWLFRPLSTFDLN